MERITGDEVSQMNANSNSDKIRSLENRINENEYAINELMKKVRILEMAVEFYGQGN